MVGVHIHTAVDFPAQPSEWATAMAAPPSVREMKRVLNAANVDYSDCFELSELSERFDAVRLQAQQSRVGVLKAKANAAFKRRSFAFAVRLYTEALVAAHAMAAESRDQLLVPLLSNRSACYLRLGLPQPALADAERCVQLDAAFLKGLHRLAAANQQLGRLAEAKSALERALAIDTEPENHDALQSELAQLAERTLHAPPPPPPPPPAAADAAGTGGGSLLLATLSEDLIVEVLCQVAERHGLAALLPALRSCRAFRRAAADRGCEGVWHRLCTARWPKLSEELKRESLAAVRAIGAAAAAQQPPPPAAGASADAPALVGLDWAVLLRERRQHEAAWAEGRAALSWLCEHRGPVYGLRMVGGMVGEHAVSSSEDGTLKVWDLARGAVTKTLEGHSHGILGLWADAATSGAAPRVVSGGFDADLRQWDVTKGRCVRTMAGHGGPVVSIEADDDKIVSSSFDGTLRVWNWDGHARATLPAHDGHSSGLALLGDVAFSGGDDGLVKRCGPTSAPSALPLPHQHRPPPAPHTPKIDTKIAHQVGSSDGDVHRLGGGALGRRVVGARERGAPVVGVDRLRAQAVGSARAGAHACATPPRGRLTPF